MGNLADLSEEAKSLLNKVNTIVEENKMIRAKKEADGEFFNIFSILNVEKEEVRTHSTMLSELLNPKGSHGQGDAFLKLFLKDIVHKEDLNTHDAEVLSEFSIGSINEDETTGGRIDIVIQFPDYLILIENKIDAGDQHNQLLRYRNYAKETKKKFKLLYLTKDGHDPTDYSTGSEKRNAYWECISYSYKIKKWLEDCRTFVNCPSNVKEIIGQYINLINKLTGQENCFMEKKLTDLMKENLEASIAIADNMQNLGNHLWEEFKNQIAEIAEDKNCDITQDYWDFWSNDTFLCFTPKNHREFHVKFGRVAGDCYSFYWLVKDGVKIKKKKLNCMSGDSDDQYPYGWTYFEDKFSRWNNSVLLAIKKGELKNYIENCLLLVFNELEEKNWDV